MFDKYKYFIRFHSLIRIYKSLEGTKPEMEEEMIGYYIGLNGQGAVPAFKRVGCPIPCKCLGRPFSCKELGCPIQCKRWGCSQDNPISYMGGQPPILYAVNVTTNIPFNGRKTFYDFCCFNLFYSVGFFLKCIWLLAKIAAWCFLSRSNQSVQKQ